MKTSILALILLVFVIVGCTKQVVVPSTPAKQVQPPTVNPVPAPPTAPPSQAAASNPPDTVTPPDIAVSDNPDTGNVSAPDVDTSGLP